MQSEASQVLLCFLIIHRLPVFFTIKERVQDWFPCVNIVKIVKDSHFAMSVVVTQFLRELFIALILSLLVRSLHFPSQYNTTLARDSVLCQAPILSPRPFFNRQSVSFMKVFICQSDFDHVFFLLVWKRHHVSPTYTVF